LYEALALVILEAKQAGIKIAASNTGGIPEAISNYKKVTLFEPKNVDDMSEKICSIIKKDFELSNETNSDDSLDTMYRKTIEAYSK
jgi:glycosyltransferase involved in cell wall biosynthesis